ncbi:hypothetical protein [Streptomyces noursei]|uniref:hypothetical protein n=1 Tax=Streptomyces noursei TaxID=1971 RepID=UPI0023B79CA1|nr:hypothetical protein [Streptomyces noursei]
MHSGFRNIMAEWAKGSFWCRIGVCLILGFFQPRHPGCQVRVLVCQESNVVQPGPGFWKSFVVVPGVLSVAVGELLVDRLDLEHLLVSIQTLVEIRDRLKNPC